MQHLYKAGGEWTSPSGTKYTIKAFNDSEIGPAKEQGWRESLDEISSEAKDHGVDGGEYERRIRDKIKQLGGKAAPRSSIERLEEQLAQLESGDK